jgi:hypothetical protein
MNVDADRFDELAVSLTAGRRAVVRRVLVGAVAALVARGGTAKAGAPLCGDKGAPCKQKTECCSGKCKKKQGKKKGKCQACPSGTIACPSLGACQGCCGDGDCPTGVSCVSGACDCPSKTTFCRGRGVAQCCDPQDTCDPDRGCTATTCRPSNAACTVGAAFCGGTRREPCFCMSRIGGVSCTNRGPECPPTSECTSNDDCAIGEVCADVAGCCPGGESFLGICVGPCGT